MNIENVFREYVGSVVIIRGRLGACDFRRLWERWEGR